MKPLAAALLALAAAGCASPWIELAPDEAPRVAADRLRVAAHVPEPRVHLTEVLYKVLWNETKENSYSFEGLWDPAPLLEEKLAQALRERRAPAAAPLRDGLDPAEHEKLSRESAAALAAAMKEGKGVPWITSPAPPELRALRREGAEYLFQAWLLRVGVFRQMIYGTELHVVVAARIVRLSDGAVVWFREGRGRSPISGLKSFADLEADGLARLKEHYALAVDDLVGPAGRLLVVSQD